jgi:xanthine dehydrogenase small subunit
MRFVLNDKPIQSEAARGMPTLDYLREIAGLTGTKSACREGDCGSCLVLLGEPKLGELRYRPLCSCLLPLGEVEGCHLVTIDGLGTDRLTLPQGAMVDHGASQCGYCTPGIVVALTGYLIEAPRFELEDALIAVAGNLCRCTGYGSIRRAITDLLEQVAESVDIREDRIPALVREGVLPPYFLDVGEGLGLEGSETPSQTPLPSQPVVAGGTDLYVQRPDELSPTEPFLVRRAVPPRIWTDDGSVYLASTTTAEELKRSQLMADVIPDIGKYMDLVCSLPIRHQATVAGNIVNASPIGDMTIIFLALDAVLGISSAAGSRKVPLAEFYSGYKEYDLAGGELIEWIRFPIRQRDGHFNFEKVCKRRYLDIASVNTAASIHADCGQIVEAYLSAGGVAPTPLRLRATEELVVGRSVSAETARAAAAAAEREISPISDVRGSASYKRLLLGRLILAHFHVLFDIEDGLDLEVSA